MLKILSSTVAVAFCGLMAWSGAALAQDTGTPDELVKTVVEEVMATVKADKDIQGGNLQKVASLVQQKILPNSNFQKTTQLVMGRHWAKASPEQQQQIVTEFEALLVRTYSGAIAKIRDQKVEYKPSRTAPEDTEAVVRTQVVGKGDPLQIDYRLEKTAAGWKLYDINVLGAWLVEAYRNQFNELVNRGGVEGLLKFLQDRNKQLSGK